MKSVLRRFLLGVGDRLTFIAQAQSGRCSCQMAVAVLLCAVAATPARCQLALPEFFGFYAADGGRTIALYEGKDAAGTTKITHDLYSVPRKGPLPYTVPVVSPSARFLLFYQNAGEMIKAMTFHRLPLVRNVIETPDPSQASLGILSGKPVNPRVIGTPNKSLLARIPELEARILTKPVPNQLQMVELVPNTTLAPGLYVFDYSPSPNQGWHAVISIRSSEQEKPYCLDLMLPGGYGGLFESANSELNDTVPALGSYRYKACDASNTSNASETPITNTIGAGGNGGTGGEFDLTSAWDRALSLGQTAAIGLCRARGGFIVRSCEQGTLSLSPQEVSFSLSNGQKIFAAPPSQVKIRKDSIFDGVFLIDTGGKASRFQYLPLGVDCPDRMEAFVACPPEGVKQQVTVANYVDLAIRKLASGGFGSSQRQ